jgi:hypothetical protein
MHEPTDRSSAERQQRDDAIQPSARKVPQFIRSLPATRFGWRHVKGVAVIRLAVAVWLVILGSVFFARGYWGWGAILFVAAGGVGWLAYQMPRWKIALDAEQNVRLPR